MTGQLSLSTFLCSPCGGLYSMGDAMLGSVNGAHDIEALSRAAFLYAGNRPEAVYGRSLGGSDFVNLKNVAANMKRLGCGLEANAICS